MHIMFCNAEKVKVCRGHSRILIPYIPLFDNIPKIMNVWKMPSPV